ncbi:unnamed protein product [Lactuca virosa]|uniref:Uncharacterized protein n=1 Tax=Lactuca virosa TaxID=75947 RepID=A0AAU9MVT3_9ASTR|nr:unnamed protein product [Lactuca virosa]
MQDSQEGDKGTGGVGSSKDVDKEKGVVVGKVSSTQIPPSLPMYLTTTSTTTTTRSLTKGMSINESARGSISSSIPNQPTSNDDPSEKGKDICVVLS